MRWCAIERDKSEICVAPVRQRALARFTMPAPEIFGRMAGLAAVNVQDAIAAGQRDER